MGLLDGGIARAFGSAFRGLYLDATLHRRQLVEDGRGGGSSTWVDEPVKAQLDSATEAMRASDGYTDKDQRILVLADGLDLMDTDAEITIRGNRWGIASVNQDPAGAAYDLHGRFMGNVERVAEAALVAVCVGGFAEAGQSIAPALVIDARFDSASYLIDNAAVAISDIFSVMEPWSLPCGTGEYGARIPGEGWAVQKEIGWSDVCGSVGPYANFKIAPALFDRLNDPTGFTAVVDYRFDNFIEGVVAHHNGSVTVAYGEPTGNIEISLLAGTHDNARHGVFTGDEAISADSYNYTTDPWIEAYDDYGSLVADKEGTSVHTFAPQPMCYFVSNLAVVGKPVGGIAFPNPDANCLHLRFRASAHQGTQADKLAVQSRTTVKRFRIFTPARPEGWVPSLAHADIVNGIYTLDEAPVSGFADLFHADGAWGTFAGVTEGVGVVYSNTVTAFNGFVATAALKALIDFHQGCIVVMEYTLAQTGTKRPKVLVGMFDFPDQNTDWSFNDSTDPVFGYPIIDDSTTYNYASTGSVGTFKTAVRLSKDKIAFSKNGAAVVDLGVNPTDLAGLTDLAFYVTTTGPAGGTATATLRSITIYRDNAGLDLAGLAA